MLTSRFNRRRLVLAGSAAAVAVPCLSSLSVSAQDAITATMVTDTAGIGDQSFNDMANEGGLRAQDELGITFNVLESQTAADYVRNLTDAAESGDITLGIGFLLTDALAEVAAMYPEHHFALIDSVVEADNVVNYLFREQEGAFLAGVVAALTTQTNQIGFVGGVRIPPVMRYEVGYVAGAKSVNPDIEIAIAYADDFEDPDTGKELSLAQFNAGADIVHAAAGRTGIGAFDAAIEKGEGFWVLAADRDQASLGEDVQLAAVVKGIDTGVFDSIKSVQDGTFEGGTYNLGIADNGITLGAIHSSVSAENLAIIEAYSAAIAGGAIVPPVDDDTLESFELVAPDAIPAGEATPEDDATPEG